MANTFTITRETETKTFTIERGVGRDGTDASVNTANVRAAGALMDDEVDADIKTLSLPANTTISAFGATLVDDATASDARTTLGLGTAATTASTAYATAAQGAKADRAALVDVVNSFEQQTGFQQGIDDGTGSGGQNLIPAAAGTLINSADARLTDERVPTAAGLAAKITAATTKATPVDADEIPLADSAASFGLKKLTWANLKATTKTYFDTLYVALTGNQTIAGNKTLSGETAFSSVTRPTSSGTGLPLSTSLITYGDFNSFNKLAVPSTFLTVNNSTTLVDSELLVVLEANSAYEISFQVYITNLNGAARAKWKFVYTGTLNGSDIQNAIWTSFGNAGGTNVRLLATAANTDLVYGVDSTDIICTGTAIIRTTTTGNFKIQFAQEVAVANDSYLQGYSRLVAKKIS